MESVWRWKEMGVREGEDEKGVWVWRECVVVFEREGKRKIKKEKGGISDEKTHTTTTTTKKVREGCCC